MTVRNLEFLFRPGSIAVVAEPDEPSRYADVVRRNLAAGGFAGPVVAVSAKQRSLFGLGSHVHIDKLEVVPDLAIVCAALRDVPQIVAKLGARGTRAAIVGPSMRDQDKMSAGELAAARKAILDAARPYLMRVLGPGSGGLVVPASRLNASVAPVTAQPGKIALIAQSAAVAAAVLDRAGSKGVGFSSVLHLGDSVDIDLADVLDWLAADPDTGAILVQFEAITAGRKFMSAARAAARNKPVVAIRGGRVDTGHVGGAPLAVDSIYEAALRRAGWLRIATLEDLFDAAEAMARVHPMRGERLAIVANGRGLGRIAADALLRSGGRLASLSAETLQQLGELLRTDSRLGNPLALPADVTPANWAATLAALLADADTDAVMTVYSPSPFTSSAEVAEALCGVAEHSQRNVFTCWTGGGTMLDAQQIAAAHGVLSHDSPEKAIAIFTGIVNYQRNRKLLAQMPPSIAEDFSPDIAAARQVVAEAIDAGKDTLPALQARRLLQSYGIGATPLPRAGRIGAPFADETDDEAPVGLRSALRLGVVDDPVFGPVIFLGADSTARAGRDGLVAALPPLNQVLAQDLVANSRFADGTSGHERQSLEAAACTALVRLSQLLTDIDEVVGVELDPLYIDSAGLITPDVRIRIEKRGRRSGYRRFAIRPYPKELEQRVDWEGRQLLVRPIRPEDEATLGDLLGSLDAEDLRMRFFGTMRRLPRSQLARFTQIDYDREMALVAIERDADGIEHSLGEARIVADPDNVAAEFAIVVRSDIKGKGLGRMLLRRIVDYSRSRGLSELRGETLSGNQRMQHLARELGFELKTAADFGTVELRLLLREHAGE